MREMGENNDSTNQNCPTLTLTLLLLTLNKLVKRCTLKFSSRISDFPCEKQFLGYGQTHTYTSLCCGLCVKENKIHVQLVFFPLGERKHTSVCHQFKLHEPDPDWRRKCSLEIDFIFHLHKTRCESN